MFVIFTQGIHGVCNHICVFIFNLQFTNNIKAFDVSLNFSLNKFPICCLLIVSKVVVMFRYWIRYVEYGHAEYVLYKY